MISPGTRVDSTSEAPGRVPLIDRLARAIRQAHRLERHTYALLFIDLDQFELVNDAFGHTAGDQLLTAFADRVQRRLRADDALERLASPDHQFARIGGDEFAILLEDLRDPADAARIAERIVTALREPFRIDDQDVLLTASIGVAAGAPHYDLAGDVVRDANLAMRRAKLKGKACYAVFEPAMRTQAVHRLKLEADLRLAVERQELRVEYQPIVSLATGRIAGFEALVRWARADGVVLPPGAFLDVAEQTGLILPISTFVLREACLAARAWQDQTRGSPLTMSVNISPRLLMLPDLRERIRDTLDETGLRADCLHVEMTETAMIGHSDELTQVLRRLAGLGVRLSLDDFGTGYSSLSHLHRFPISTLKIDRSFVESMDRRPNNEALVRSIVDLARSLGMEAIAEGIETRRQLTQTQSFGCKYGQGFLMSKPIARDAATQLVRNRTSLLTMH
jgi:diguanylate cyclase (GGDEF)-like protein